MPRKFQLLSIDNIADGAVKDLFEYEWDRILRDVADTTKQAKAKRTLTITLAVKPAEDRGSGDVEIEVVSKLAKPKASKGTVYLSNEEGRIVSYVNDPKQEDLIPENEEASSDR